MIKLVAFDWNGTILSDTRKVVEANSITFKKFGLKPISLLQFQKTFTTPIIDYYEANGFSRKLFLKIGKEQAQVYHDTYEGMIRNVRSRAGSKEILSWLKKNQIHAVIYSNHTIYDIEKHLRRMKLKPFIDHVIGRTGIDEQNYKRFKEQKLADYLKAHKIKPHEAVSVGDTCEEIEIGHSLKMKSVAITGGWNTIARLRAAKPDFLVHNLVKLKDIIKRLNTQSPG